MKKIFLTLFLFLCAAGLQAQMEGLHGDFLETRNGLHAGNQFRTTFYNDGTFGVNDRPPDIGGEWPINSGRIYMLDGNVFVGSEVLDEEGAVKHIVSTVRSAGEGQPGQWSSGDTGPNGEWWTFLPLPGFASSDTNKIAMSKWPWAWPTYWPDKINDPVDPGWPGAWNGYFGKDNFNADEESFFVTDDYMFKEFNFYPDSTDRDRRGLGLRKWVRGFQWSNALVEDALFALFDIENIGTHEHDKMVFGYKFGNNMGDTETAGDGGDDMGAFNKEEDVAYLFDYDDIGAGGWTPVGYFGGAFLESPGNRYDGIDNDGDGAMGSGPVITQDMFAPKTLRVGDPIVLVDYVTFERTVTTMPNDTVKVHYQDLVFKFWPGKTIEEIAHNLVDDNLNGVIDESSGAVVGEGDNAVTIYLYEGAKYIDYISGDGLDNILLDERRDDGIDNDGDWNPLTDDLGADGADFTGDTGEGDGVPTYGEPHFDKTDIDETDMLGLTSFTLYLWPDIPHYEDELVWQNIVPGYFDDLLENQNIELLYGSGYFPMKPGQIERFSMGIMCGINLDDFMENKFWVAKAYNENYNFSKAPMVPKVTAVAGDDMVTLYWDDLAESSYDPISGYDFEGYRIYRSTDPGFNDMTPITDGIGSVTYRKPLAQFDVDNEYEGYAAVPIKGIQFWLGTNSGIVNTWTDSTAKNGYKYYYAVTSYDHGAPEAGIAPTECSKFISISTTGEIDKGSNVAIVRPEAPAAGYTAPSLENLTLLEGGTATGTIGYKIIDPTLIRDGHTYQVTFEDSIETIDSRLYPVTTSMTLADVTVPGSPDTLINKTPNIGPEDQLPMTDGFKLTLVNEPQLVVNENLTRWGRDDIYGYTIQPFKYSRTLGVPRAADYRIDFGEVGIDTSTFAAISRTRELDAMPVNFTITNTTSGKKIDFALWEKDEISGEEGKFTAFTDRTRTDIIIFMEPDENDSLTFTWEFELDSETNDSLHNNPQAGDFIDIIFRKPFLSGDVVEFTTLPERIEPARAKADMDRIKVVPNPYVVANSWEPLNPYANGRGPRELHFIHLPQKCTIKIFNIRGQLVDTIEHSNTVNDGTEIWDMQTKDLLDIAYGVYVYHVDAGELGQKIGKFAVIK